MKNNENLKYLLASLLCAIALVCIGNTKIDNVVAIFNKNNGAQVAESSASNPQADDCTVQYKIYAGVNTCVDLYLASIQQSGSRTVVDKSDISYLSLYKTMKTPAIDDSVHVTIPTKSNTTYGEFRSFPDSIIKNIGAKSTNYVCGNFANPDAYYSESYIDLDDNQIGGTPGEELRGNDATGTCTEAWESNQTDAELKYLLDSVEVGQFKGTLSRSDISYQQTANIGPNKIFYEMILHGKRGEQGFTHIVTYRVSGVKLKQNPYDTQTITIINAGTLECKDISLGGISAIKIVGYINGRGERVTDGTCIVNLSINSSDLNSYSQYSKQLEYKSADGKTPVRLDSPVLINHKITSGKYNSYTNL